MALSGLQIYKLLPKTNCKDCGFPTCLAFAMKLAAKQVELSACPHVSDAAQAQLSAAAEPPVRLINLKSNGTQLRVGNEVVLFRHEKTFYHQPGLFVRILDAMSPEAINARVQFVHTYYVDYVGMALRLDGFAIQSTADADRFVAAIRQVRAVSTLPLILMAEDPNVMAAGLQSIDGEQPLVFGATGANLDAMAELAKTHQVPLVVSASSLDALADSAGRLRDKGLTDLVLHPAVDSMNAALTLNTQMRRMALKKNFRPLGYPILNIPADLNDPALEMMMAAQAIAKYAGFVIIEHMEAATIYPLLVLRQNIYTDPQKPIQVQPGLYEINNPTSASPVLVTTNFSITYFSVANEVESSGMPAWLVVTDAEGMSVLTAWAAGKFDAERIAKAVQTFDVASKVALKRLVLPGHVATLSGEVEEELPGWEVTVGPREAVDVPQFMKAVL